MPWPLLCLFLKSGNYPLLLNPKKFPLLPRKKNTHKSDYGHVLIVAGSRTMPGAAVLAAEACIHAGAGLVTLASPKSLANLIIRKMTPEIMFLPLPETKEGSVSLAAYSHLQRALSLKKINVLAIGPGLTRHKETTALVRKVVSAFKLPIVLDADGLNAFQSKQNFLKSHKGELILTPHAKEFERLFNVICTTAAPARAALAKKLSRLYDVTIVLKGHRTLVAGSSLIYKNTTGNPGMAKGGAGDVLTGIIAAFAAQGLSSFKAACWAAYFHGKAGDKAVKVKGELSLLASDIIEFLPEAIGDRNSLE